MTLWPVLLSGLWDILSSHLTYPGHTGKTSRPCGPNWEPTSEILLAWPPAAYLQAFTQSWGGLAPLRALPLYLLLIFVSSSRAGAKASCCVSLQPTLDLQVAEIKLRPQEILDSRTILASHTQNLAKSQGAWHTPTATNLSRASDLTHPPLFVYSKW